jgi:hypothetical protein
MKLAILDDEAELTIMGVSLAYSKNNAIWRLTLDMACS